MTKEECPACGEMVDMVECASLYGDEELFNSVKCPQCDCEFEGEDDSHADDYDRQRDSNNENY